jgi:hypothetical protein
MDTNEFTEFTIDNISKYLTYNKNILVGMNLVLDSYEISKSLTSSLNRSLIGTKTKLSDIYDSIANNFDDMTNKVKIIEEKIKEFNLEQKLGYFIDPDNIIILVFYKQFLYVQKLISEISNSISSNINLVFIYFYLISRLYDEPEKISYGYIYIIERLMGDQGIENKYGNRLKEFLNSDSLNIIFNIIKIVYKSDIDFLNLNDELKKEKMDEYKKNIIVDHSESYEKIANEFSNLSGGTDSEAEIFNKIEQKYEKKKNYILLQKRNIDISNLLNSDNVNLILNESTSIELWHGYNLFIYKRFNYDFADYQKNINEIIKQKQLDSIYLLNLDYLNNLDVPDAGILLPSVIGGSSYSSNSSKLNNFDTHKFTPYYLKYFKYKNKYVQLKKKILSNK